MSILLRLPRRLWRLKGSSRTARRHILAFRDGPVPVLFHLRADDGAFDPYAAFRRAEDDAPLGDADLVEACVLVTPRTPRMRRRILGLPLGRSDWVRERAVVERSVRLPEIRLPSGNVVPSRRVSRVFASGTLRVRGMGLRQQDAAFIAWAEPFVAQALAEAEFAARMLAGTAEMWSLLDGLDRRPDRAAYEAQCRRFGAVPLADRALLAAAAEEVEARRFPDCSVAEAVRSHLHAWRRDALLAPPRAAA